MTEKRSWKNELDEYINQGDPSLIERANNWKTSIGLQKVDGLSVSDYLIDTAKEHIEGKITITEAIKRIENYHNLSEKR